MDRKLDFGTAVLRPLLAYVRSAWADCLPMNDDGFLISFTSFSLSCSSTLGFLSELAYSFRYLDKASLFSNSSLNLTLYLAFSSYTMS